MSENPPFLHHFKLWVLCSGGLYTRGGNSCPTTLGITLTRSLSMRAKGLSWLALPTSLVQPNSCVSRAVWKLSDAMADAEMRRVNGFCRMTPTCL
ncbi:hypothetical protein Y1Q_0016106 [Alligator mississippiensis]|uniref:Uncharacterized protein n=1 Tax=Alligator mississippiensis TaxID=8496 RepID=A0A151NPG5_ALLMI|nr:hypothetical protein Y1Q_0016106 [Alligator mississippiensis]